VSVTILMIYVGRWVHSSCSNGCSGGCSKVRSRTWNAFWNNLVKRLLLTIDVADSFIVCHVVAGSNAVCRAARDEEARKVGN
jgi:hypothetical protein